MNVSVSDIAFDVSIVDVCSANNQHLERVLKQRKANPFRDKGIRVHSPGHTEDNELGFGISGICGIGIFCSRGTVSLSTNGEERQTQVHLRSSRA